MRYPTFFQKPPTATITLLNERTHPSYFTSPDVLLKLIKHDNKLISLTIYGLRIWDMKGNQLEKIDFNYSTHVFSLANGNLLIGNYCEVVIYNLQAHKVIHSLRCDPGFKLTAKSCNENYSYNYPPFNYGVPYITGLCYNDRYIIVSFAGKVFAWDYKKNQYHSLFSVLERINTMALFLENYLIVGFEQSEMRIYELDIPQAKLVAQFSHPGKHPHYSSINKILPLRENYFATAMNNIAIWKFTNTKPELVIELAGHSIINDLQWTQPNILVSCTDSSIKFWDIAKLEEKNNNRRNCEVRHNNTRCLIPLSSDELILGNAVAQIHKLDFNFSFETEELSTLKPN